MADTAPPILLRVPEAAEMLSISRTQFYDTLLAPRGPIPCIRIGTCVRIPAAALRAWVDEQTAAALGAPAHSP